MTKPTQAQIEAAASAMHRYDVEHGFNADGLGSAENYLPIAEAALLAAAEAENDDIMKGLYPEQKAALTAAAEAGMKTKPFDYLAYLDTPQRLVAYIKEQEAEIERLTEELAISAQAVGVSEWRRQECLRLQAEIERLRAALTAAAKVEEDNIMRGLYPEQKAALTAAAEVGWPCTAVPTKDWICSQCGEWHSDHDTEQSTRDCGNTAGKPAAVSPTQAQLSAALMAYSETITEVIDRKGCLGPDDRQGAMLAALTAAAEVGPSEATLIHTAADAIENAALARLEEATIERCAKVAESYDGYISAPSPKALAAAIRALKDKP